MRWRGVSCILHYKKMVQGHCTYYAFSFFVVTLYIYKSHNLNMVKCLLQKKKGKKRLSPFLNDEHRMEISTLFTLGEGKSCFENVPKHNAIRIILHFQTSALQTTVIKTMHLKNITVLHILKRHFFLVTIHNKRQA